MSGRAGRRGLDARGIVIMMCEQKLEPEAAKGMVKGQADRLDSAFHLGYNMILNLMRVEGVSPEYMLERCFYQFQNTANIPVLEDRKSPFRPIALGYGSPRNFLCRTARPWKEGKGLQDRQAGRDRGVSRDPR